MMAAQGKQGKCSMEELESFSRQAQQELEKERAQARIRACGIPKAYQSVSFDQFVAESKPQQAALSTSSAYAKGVINQSDFSDWLIFSGRCGTGKTMLASAIAASCIKSLKNVRFTTQRDFLEGVKETWGRRDMSQKQVMARYEKADLLIIDEIGNGPAFANDAFMIASLIEKRYDDLLPVVMISNLPLTGESSIESCLGERVFDRARERTPRSNVVAFSWESKRGRK
jgi:DNA replication protein DnaC